MAQINLLPWREELRQEKKKAFITQLAGMCIFAALASFVWVKSVDSSIESQKQRNNMLQSEIILLEKQVAEIKDLKKRKKELLDRKRVIEGLEGKRSVIVRYFDELVRAVPDGIYVTLLSRRANLFTIEGVSESNNRVSAFMRQLNGSECFSDPNLKSVVADSKLGEQSSKFSMQLNAVDCGKGKDVSTEEGE